MHYLVHLNFTLGCQHSVTKWLLLSHCKQRLSISSSLKLMFDLVLPFFFRNPVFDVFSGFGVDLLVVLELDNSFVVSIFLWCILDFDFVDLSWLRFRNCCVLLWFDFHHFKDHDAMSLNLVSLECLDWILATTTVLRVLKWIVLGETIHLRTFVDRNQYNLTWNLHLIIFCWSSDIP